MDVIDQMLLIDWLVDNYKSYGSRLFLITDKSDEGSQFAKGFGGFGAILRYKLDNFALNEEDDQENEASNDALLNEDFSDY